VEALVGVHGSEGPVPNSIAARAHPEAVLGWGMVPTAFEVSLKTAKYNTKDNAKRDAFLNYLQAVVDALRPEGYPTRQVLLDALSEYAARHDLEARQASVAPFPAGSCECSLCQKVRAWREGAGKP